MNLLLVIILAIVVFAIGFAGMAIRILVKKGGEFPNTHVSGNKYLKIQGVYCTQIQDKLEQRKAWKKTNYDKIKFVPDMKAGK